MLSRYGIRTLFLLVCLALAQTFSPARAADDPAGLVADLGGQAIGVLASSLSDTDRERRLRTLFTTGFDLPAISRFVLGPYWQAASDAQQREFTALFETYIVHTYAQRLRAYSGQQLTVFGFRSEGENAALVESQIAPPQGGTGIKVVWHLINGDNGFSIVDFVVGGVSMALTQRQEFASIIQRGGGELETLLALLRRKTTVANR